MVFALDVGTRKVAGLIATREGDAVTVYDVEVLEHEKRAMLDGQVHDVERVSRTVRAVKESLEKRNEVELKRVAIALAGRYLETVTGEAQIELPRKEIDSDTVLNLELEAVKNAVEKIPQDEMFCVGYSVLSYELDGSWMMKLEGHVGKVASVKVIAAFLPVQVVDSMTSVIKSVGLEIDHMTLEPIAAMEVAVPEELRLLNIALVDVGAGTSDIAISRDGTVTAYGMVPKAGDEITEIIAKEFLLDFNEAERLKRSLSSDLDEYEVVDVLDRVRKIGREEMLKLVDPVLEEITSEIAATIEKLNSGIPKAVMVVGGGAKVPGFVEKLRERLGLPEDRVRLKSVEGLRNVQDKTGRVVGSEMVTPVGIAKNALFGRGGAFSKVYVNGVPVKLIGFTGGYTVMQVLLQAGYDIADVLGRSSSTVVYEINGRVRAHRSGSFSPVIKVNGERASTRTRVRHGDRIEVEFPDVQPEKPKVGDVVGFVEVSISGKKVRVYPRITLNGEEVDPETPLNDGDRIEHDTKIPVSYILEKLSESITVYLNGERLEFKPSIRLFKEDEEISEGSVELGERLTAVLSEKPKIGDLIKDMIPKIRVRFNGSEVELPTEEVELFSNGTKISMDTEVEDGMKINAVFKRSTPIVATLLSVVDLDTRTFKRYKILKNGVETSFADTLKDGDDVQFIEEG